MRQESKYHVILFGPNKSYLDHKNFTSFIGAKEWAKSNKNAVVAEIYDRRELLFSGNRDKSIVARYTKV